MSPRGGDDLPIYELTVLKTHGETETRYTDVPPELGATVRIDGRPATVVSRHADPANEHADARYVCRLAAASDPAAAASQIARSG